MNDFASGTSFFSSDAFANDDSPPDDVFMDLFVLAGDVFEGFMTDDGLRLFFGGDFLTALTFDGETF